MLYVLYFLLNVLSETLPYLFHSVKSYFSEDFTWLPPELTRQLRVFKPVRFLLRQEALVASVL